MPRNKINTYFTRNKINKIYFLIILLYFIYTYYASV